MSRQSGEHAVTREECEGIARGTVDAHKAECLEGALQEIRDEIAAGAQRHAVLEASLDTGFRGIKLFVGAAFGLATLLVSLAMYLLAASRSPSIVHQAHAASLVRPSFDAAVMVAGR